MEEASRGDLLATRLCTLGWNTSRWLWARGHKLSETSREGAPNLTHSR